MSLPAEVRKLPRRSRCQQSLKPDRRRKREPIVSAFLTAHRFGEHCSVQSSKNTSQMKKPPRARIALILCALALSLLNASGQSAPTPAPATSHDVVVYGDSSGAVVAAISAKREGRSVIWVNPTGFPGGMSASGLGATDFLGKQGTFGGIAAEFYRGVAAAYGTDRKSVV